MTQHVVIVRDPKTTIRIDEKYLIVKKQAKSSVISFQYIRALYLYIGLRIELALLEKMSRHVPIFLIDRHGYIQAKLVREDEKA